MVKVSPAEECSVSQAFVDLIIDCQVFGLRHEKTQSTTWFRQTGYQFVLDQDLRERGVTEPLIFQPVEF